MKQIIHTDEDSNILLICSYHIFIQHCFKLFTCTPSPTLATI